MRRITVLALTGVTAMAVLATGGAMAARRAPAGQRGSSVTIRIEGLKKTLVLPRRVQPSTGWITKDGAPKGKCPRQSVQGALDAAAHGHWNGTWYSQYNEYLITSILGEKPPDTSHFWEILVNNKAAAKGACDLKLRAGEQLLFADTTSSDFPAKLTSPKHATKGSAFQVKLVGYTKNGTTKPLAGVKIKLGGSSVTTNNQGVAKVTAKHTGRLVLRASPSGYIRTEAIVHVKS